MLSACSARRSASFDRRLHGGDRVVRASPGLRAPDAGTGRSVVGSHDQRRLYASCSSNGSQLVSFFSYPRRTLGHHTRLSKFSSIGHMCFRVSPCQAHEYTVWPAGVPVTRLPPPADQPLVFLCMIWPSGYGSLCGVVQKKLSTCASCSKRRRTSAVLNHATSERSYRGKARMLTHPRVRLTPRAARAGSRLGVERVAAAD